MIIGGCLGGVALKCDRMNGFKKGKGWSLRFTLASRPIAKSDVPGNVIVKTGNTPKRWRLDCNKFAIAHEMTGTSVKDHDAFEVQNTEGAPVGKIGTRRLRIYQFHPKVLDLAGENF